MLERVPRAVNGLVGEIIDGELVALGPDGRPNFDMLQSLRSSESHIVYCAFDILIHDNRDPDAPAVSSVFSD